MNQKYTSPKWLRTMNRDGSFNFEPSRGKRAIFEDLYHGLLRASWRRFFALLVGVQALLNLGFATAYWFCGPTRLPGMTEVVGWRQFADGFFFSIQTIFTIGYGRISPVGILANTLVALEAFLGMLAFAVVTGLFFARLSRPRAKVIFSEKAVISPHDGVPALVLRLANARQNYVASAQVRVTLLQTEYTAEGERYRFYYDLELERSTNPIFALSWTVVHYINEKSPLFGVRSEKDLLEREIEILVLVSGLDEAYAQEIHARISYTAEDIVFGRYFADVIERNDEGKIRLRIDRFHDLREAPPR